MVLCRGVKGVEGTDSSCPLWSRASGMVCEPTPLISFRMAWLTGSFDAQSQGLG